MLLMNAYIKKINSRHIKVVKFIISGGTSAATSIAVLFMLTHFFHIWYLFSAIVAFFFAFFVSFFLQKFWTFGDSSLSDIRKQLLSYLTIILCNLALNTLFLY